MPASTYIDRQKYPKCIIESNIKNGPIDNIIDQSYYPEATIGCYMYKFCCGSTPHTFPITFVALWSLMLVPTIMFSLQIARISAEQSSRLI